MQSVDTYLSLTSRRITFEYIMIKDVNDRDEDAEALIELVRGRRAYVNLIPYNPVSEFAYETSSKTQLKRFYDRLMQAGIQATTRKEKGDQVNAACGQLRLKKLKEATHEYSDVETRSKTEL
jgi:23S rRNA (adenine2503-C2)-methyltransferase